MSIFSSIKMRMHNVRLVIPAGSNNVAIYSGLYFSTYFTASGRVPTKLILPPDVKIETTFFQRKFFITEPCNYPQKIVKKEPPISQKSLFYAISLKFICCLHCCLFHIKFDQIMLYMAHSSQSVCLFLIPITCIPDHP